MRGSFAILLIVARLLTPAAAIAQSPPSDAAPTVAEPVARTPLSMFDHPDTSRLWLSGQLNVVTQWHPSFHSSYSGANSLQAQSDSATSYVVTLFTGLQITNSTEAILDVEATGGSGLSDALGVAGFPNLDVVRNPGLGHEPYVARGFVRQIIPLSDDYVDASPTPFALTTRLPERRVEIRAGKIGLVDFFDTNAVGSDNHLQFMNWTVDTNGAFDFAADTRGYTYALLIEYQDRAWGARFGEALMPTVANGINLNWHIDESRAENLELEHRQQCFGRDGVVRLLAYMNHANMGNYRQANATFLEGRSPVPDIAASRQPGRTKYGFGLNLEQALTAAIRIFARAGWNDGQSESFAFTEVDRSAAAGADIGGNAWHRDNDKLGLAVSINALSDPHREYLALGGSGFLLGDGRLNYGTEQIVEGYYTLHVWRGVFAAADLQYIRHPGFNRDRGPVLVPGLRFHTDF